MADKTNSHPVLRLRKLFRPLVLTTILLLVTFGYGFVWTQAAKTLRDNTERLTASVSNQLGRTLGTLSLLSRLSSIESSLRYQTTEPVEKALNHAITGEASIPALVVRDGSGNVFATNSVAASGAYLGRPPILDDIPIGHLRFKRYESERYGLVQIAADGAQNSRFLFLQKTIYYEDEPVGTIATVLDVPSLASSLRNENQSPSGNVWIYLEGTTPNGSCDVSTGFLNGIRICGANSFTSQLSEASLGLVVVSLFIGLLSALLWMMRGVMDRNFFIPIETELAVQAARLELADQVAHDIRSPLAALSVIEGQSELLPESTRVILRSVITRINDIATALVKSRSRSEARDELTIEPVVAVLATLILEKRTEYRSQRVVELILDQESQKSAAAAKVNLGDFKRVISNLINNSVEAMSGSGRITISIREQEKQVEVLVSDTGSGIPASIVENLGRKRVTYGKPKGSGLGLYHAMTCVETWGGKLEISSILGEGTTVRLWLPKADPPEF